MTFEIYSFFHGEYKKAVLISMVEIPKSSEAAMHRMLMVRTEAISTKVSQKVKLS